MNKKVRKLIPLALAILIAGTFFSGCGSHYIFNSANSLRKEDANNFNVEKSEVDPITQIEIHTGMAEVELIPADNFYVEIDFMYWEEEPEYTLEDGKLYFNDSHAFPNSYSINFNLDNKIKIYLPKDTALSKLYLENASGDVSIAGFVAEDLEVRVAYGDFTMKDAAAAEADVTLSSGTSKISDFQAGTLDFTNSYGNAKFTNINTGDPLMAETVSYDKFKVGMSSGNVNILGLNSSSVEISDSYGNISCEEVVADEFDTELSSGDLEVSKSDINDIETNNSYGDVTLTLAGPASDYTLDLNTSYGKISVGNKDYEEHLILENGGTRSIAADLSSGNVRVRFED
ncbi:MAG: hypothetical protein K0S01_87 [Herbinix sp.]|jgi:DUF4097 and DUF4098 domain-containing protein YvlB|nr:hypothetical protein [Herbinix sp.]